MMFCQLSPLDGRGLQVIAMGGDPYIRHVDGCPTPPSQLGEVNGGDVIGIVLVATADASEQPAISIHFINSSTAWTPLRSVIWLNVNYWNTLLQAFVFDHLLESSKSPAVEGSVVAFPALGSVSNPIQLLHHDEVSASDQRVNESSANLVQNCIYSSSLPPSQPFKLPPCGGSALILEGASELPKMSPPVLDWLTINSKPVGSYQEIVNPNINTNWITSRRFWNFHQNSNMQVEFPAIPSVDEFSISYRVLQKLLLIISNSKLNLNSPVNRGYGHSKLSIPKESEQSLIQIHRKLLELVLLLSIGFVRLGNSISRPYRKIGGKLKSFTSFIVNKVVQCHWVKTSSLPSYLADIVTGVSKGFNSIYKLLEFFFSRIKLAYHRLGNFHRNSYMPLVFKNLTKVEARFPPTLTDGVSSGGV